LLLIEAPCHEEKENEEMSKNEKLEKAPLGFPRLKVLRRGPSTIFLTYLLNFIVYPKKLKTKESYSQF
jgi:hypothetical protein